MIMLTIRVMVERPRKRERRPRSFDLKRKVVENTKQTDDDVLLLLRKRKDGFRKIVERSLYR